jgi:predicted small metal-binding protein
MPDQQGRAAKRFACSDVVPGCGFIASAASEDELMKQVAAHATEHHHIAEVTPELAAKVKAAIRTA